MSAPFVPYVQHGWALCSIPKGEKGPRSRGWNKPGRALTAEQAEHITSGGLLHAYSGTCALDIDDLDRTRAYFAKHGVDLDALLAAPDAVGITSGTPNRAKLLFALPAPLPTKKIVVDGVTLFELRCADAAGVGTVQDVLPPSRHPSGRAYEWRYGDDLTGDWRNPPPLPDALRALWQSFLPSTSAAAPSAAGEESAGTSSAEVPQAQAAGESLIADAQRILAATDSSCDYDTWIKLGMALEHELGADGWQLWRDWSATSHKFPGDAQLESHWNSFGRSPTPITLGSFKRQLAASRDDFDDLSTADLEADPFEAMARERAPRITLENFGEGELLGPIEPERYTMPGLPVDAYALLAGGLSAYKSRLATAMAITRATGRDILRMYPGARIISGAVWLLSYEDNGKRVRSRFQQVIQHYHADILAVHGPDAAAQFIADINRNVVRSTFVGRPDARFTVTRDRELVPNDEFISALVEQARAIRDARGEDLLMILDPLRLAVGGEMNEGEAASVAANTFNHVATEIGNCCLLVVSHTTKVGGTEGVGGGFADASYATSGSAVLSQHARSNFHMGRLSQKDAKKVAPHLPAEVIECQQIAKLRHGRDSYSEETRDAVFQMVRGVLVPIEKHDTGKPQTVEKLNEHTLPLFFAAYDEVKATGKAFISPTALHGVPQVREAFTKAEWLAQMELLRGVYFEVEGKTRTTNIVPSSKWAEARDSLKLQEEEDRE